MNVEKRIIKFVKRAGSTGLSMPDSTNKPSRLWTKEEDKILKELYPNINIPLSTICQILHRTRKGVSMHALTLKLTRTGQADIDYELLEETRRALEGEVHSV